MSAVNAGHPPFTDQRGKRERTGCPAVRLQITSLFMHASPALVAWCWRWYPDQRRLHFDTMSREQQRAYNTLTWFDLLVLSMGELQLLVPCWWCSCCCIWQPASPLLP